jgi:hypothetical protein
MIVHSVYLLCVTTGIVLSRGESLITQKPLSYTESYGDDIAINTT